MDSQQTPSKIAFSWAKPNGKILAKARDFCYNPHPYSAMVGGIRNAKTTAACRRIILLASAYPGNRLLVARYQNTDLEKSTLLILREELEKCGKKFVRADNKNGKYFTLWNDSTIYYSHLDVESDAQGTEWGGIYLDELHEIRLLTFQQLIGRVTFWNPQRVAEFRENKLKQDRQRAVLGYNVDPKGFFFITQNPNPNWTKEMIKNNVHGKFHVIESTTEDNKENLPDGWYEDMIRTMPKDWVDRMMMNNWDVAGGQVYKEFSTSIHCIDSFPLLDHWQRITTLDFGWTHPTAVLFGAVDEFGNIFVYDEHAASEMLPTAHAEIIKQKSDKFCQRFEDGLKVLADPSGKGTQASTGRSLFYEYGQLGIYCQEANNEVQAGIVRVQEYFHVDPKHVHPVTKALGSPRLFIFRDKCPKLIKELVEYEWEKLPLNMGPGYKEKPRKIGDDLADDLRYMCMSRPRPSEIPEKEEPRTMALAMKSIARFAFTKQENEDDDN